MPTTNADPSTSASPERMAGDLGPRPRIAAPDGGREQPLERLAQRRASHRVFTEELAVVRRQAVARRATDSRLQAEVLRLQRRHGQARAWS